VSDANFIRAAYVIGVACGALLCYLAMRTMVNYKLDEARQAIAAAEAANKAAREALTQPSTRLALRFRCPVCPHAKVDHGPTGCTKCGCKAIPS
jgi:hypothetical protein